MYLRRLWQRWLGKKRLDAEFRRREQRRPIMFEPLEERRLLTVNFTPVLNSFTTPASKDLLIPLTATDSNGGAITYSVVNNTNAANVAANFVSGGTTIVFNVSGKDGSNNDFTGDITVRMFDTLAPITVERMRELVAQHFYNGLTFHRIVGLGGGSTARIAQGGDPAGSGGGGPGTQIDDEFNSTLTFNSPGLLAMAKSNDDTNGSQFFFVNADAGLANSPQHLNFNHTILGQVVAGFDTLANVMATPANGSGTPNSTMRINSVREVTDTQNGILRLDPGASFTGSTTITVIATGSGGQTASQTFTVSIAADTINESPFLNAFPAAFQGNTITTTTNTPVTFSLSATDLENDSLTFQILDAATGLPPTGNVTASVNGSSITLTPANGFNGTVRLRARVTGANTNTGSVDDNQAFTLVVGSVPTVSLAFDQAALAESGGSANLIATLSQTSSQAVTVNLGFGGTAILDAGGFTANALRDYSAPLTITIPAGQLTASIPFNLVDDTLDELDETAVVEILSASNAAATTNNATLTIQDNDTTPTLSLNLSSNSFAENGGTSTVLATLSAPSGQDVRVDLAFTGSATLNSDYSRSGTQIVIPAGQTLGTITLRGLAENVNDDNETVVVSAVNPINATLNSGQSSASATILDDDLGISLSTNAGQVGESGGTATITATLDQTHSTAVTIPLLTGGSASAGDFQLSATTISIAAGQTAGSAILNAVNDALNEPTETVVVSLGTVSAGSVVSSASSTSVNLIDNDPLGVSLNVSNVSIAENGGSASIVATLNQTHSAAVTITLGFSGVASTASDYTPSATTISIPSGELTGSILLSASNDSISEGTESIVVSFASATEGFVAVQGAVSVSSTITDDEASPQVAISASGTLLAETGGTVTLVARSNIVSANDILVPITFAGTATQGADYSASSTSIRIAAGQTSGSISITAINDSAIEADETVILGVGSITNGTQSGSFAQTLSITSDDRPAVSMSLSTTTIAENGGATTVSATLNASSSQTVTIPLTITGVTATLNTDFSASTNAIIIAAGQTSGSLVIRGINDNLFESNETLIVAVSNNSISGASLSGSFSQTVTITSEDTTFGAPDLDAGSDDGPSSTDNYTSDSTPSFTITASSGQQIDIRVNGVSMGPATDNGNNTYSITLPDNKLKVGSNVISAHGSTTSSTTSITYAPKFDEAYRVGGELGAAQNVTFDFSALQAKYRSEVGVYLADDASGRIGALNPGDAGYARAALERSSTLFVRGVAVGANQVITLTGGQVLGFYLVQNGTKAEALALNPNNVSGRPLGLGGPVTFFSFDNANPDGVRHVQVVGDSVSGHAEYRWEDLFGGGDMDFNDFVFSVNLAGTNVRATMETLRVPAAPATTASATFTLSAGQTSSGSSAFSNLGGEFGIFKITDPSGTVNNLSPGSAGWLAAALADANRTAIFSSSDVSGAVRSLNLTGNELFGFYRIKGGSASQFLTSNPSNASSGSIYAIVSFDPANPDDQDHFRWYGPETVSQGITGQGDDDDTIRLHVMDALFGDESAFDAFSVSIDF